jgi:hypothetical protein
MRTKMQMKYIEAQIACTVFGIQPQLTEQILQELEAGRRSAWMNVVDRSTIHNSYWAQRKYLVIYGVQEFYWESASGEPRPPKYFLPEAMRSTYWQNSMKDIREET